MTPTATRGRSRPPAGAFGIWLAAVLENRGMRQADLAREMRVDPSTVSKWHRGSAIPDIPHCDSIARALGIPPYEVIGMTGRVTRPSDGPLRHPVRERACALIDVIDPQALEEMLPLLERLARLSGDPR